MPLPSARQHWHRVKSAAECSSVVSASVNDPKYTVIPQRERLRRRFPATAAEAPG